MVGKLSTKTNNSHGDGLKGRVQILKVNEEQNHYQLLVHDIHDNGCFYNNL